MKVGRNQWRKTRVLAAAGLTLGLGATGTVAAFNDTVWSNAQFKGASFGIEGSTDTTDGINGTWSNHFTESSAAVITFGTSPNLLISPGTTAYQRFSLRTTPGATSSLPAVMSAGTISYTGSTTAEMVAPFSFRAFMSPNHSCDTRSTGQAGISYLLGTATTTVSATASPTSPGTISLPAGTATGPGAGITLCFAIGLPNTVVSDIANGADFSVTWKFETQISV